MIFYREGNVLGKCLDLNKDEVGEKYKMLGQHNCEYFYLCRLCSIYDMLIHSLVYKFQSAK